jgi:hypothetical protein
VNHRRFALEVAREAGLALPGARMVDSLRSLTDHLDRGGAEASGGAWVAKAPFSAAGRDRVLGTSPADLGGPELRRRLENLFERRGPLLVEPWVARTADFGWTGAVAHGSLGSSLGMSGTHLLEVDRVGRFTGVVLPAEGERVPGLGREDGELLAQTADEVGRRLASAGYAGPFGLDAYRWRDSGGRVHFQPLGEINARMTFGLVARALVDRVRGPLGAPPDRTVALRLGRRPPPSSSAGECVPLVLPGEGAPGAWLVVSPGAR